MKLLLVNSVCGIGSTGKIVARIADDYIARGHEAIIAYGRSDTVPERLKPISYRIGTTLSVKWHALSTRLFDNHGFCSNRATKEFLSWANEYNPDVLGVANVWDARKGLFDFFKLRSKLNDQYHIVLVGLNEKQMKILPSGITGIPRTNSAKELAAIYTAADVFFNPTYEDTSPCVNLEAEACGTPVITYNTGGARETIKFESSFIIEKGNWEQAIQNM